MTEKEVMEIRRKTTGVSKSRITSGFWQTRPEDLSDLRRVRGEACDQAWRMRCLFKRHQNNHQLIGISQNATGLGEVRLLRHGNNLSDEEVGFSPLLRLKHFP